MKKILLFVLSLSLLLATPCFADHWVLVRLYDKYSLTQESDKGVSKEGDIISIFEANVDNEPTELEKIDYAVFRVRGFDEEDMLNLLSEWEGNAYRRFRLRENFIINLDEGLQEEVYNSSQFIAKTRQKKIQDLANYKRGRRWYMATVPFRKAYRKVVEVFDFWVKPAYAAVSCADNATAGEQICTCNTSGEDYNTPQSWESAKDGVDLTSIQQIRTLEIYNDQGTLAGTERLTIDGNTTDASYYWKVTMPAGERHDGRRGTPIFQYTGVSSSTILISDTATRIEWLEIDAGSMTGGTKIAITLDSTALHTVEKNLIYDAASQGIFLFQSDFTTVRNNVIYGGGVGIRNNINSDSSNAYSNTVIGCSSNGIQGDDSTTDLRARNNLVLECGTDFSGTFNGSSSHNGCSDSSCPAGSAQTDLASTNEVTSIVSGAEDFHLNRSATVIDQGVSVGSSTDIEGHARSDYDIGADEYKLGMIMENLMLEGVTFN